MDYTVINKSDKNLPYGFALHPYFALLSGRDKTLVMLPGKSLADSDEELLPTGKLSDVSGTKFDLRKPTPVNELELDHLFTDLNRSTPPYIDYSVQKTNYTLKAQMSSLTWFCTL